MNPAKRARPFFPTRSRNCPYQTRPAPASALSFLPNPSGFLPAALTSVFRQINTVCSSCCPHTRAEVSRGGTRRPWSARGYSGQHSGQLMASCLSLSFPFQIKLRWKHTHLHHDHAAQPYRPVTSIRAFFGSLILCQERRQTDSPRDNRSLPGQLRHRQEEHGCSGDFVFGFWLIFIPQDVCQSGGFKHESFSSSSPLDRVTWLAFFPGYSRHLPRPSLSSRLPLLPLSIPLSPRFSSSECPFHTTRVDSPQISSLPFKGIGHPGSAGTWGSPGHLLSPLMCLNLAQGR